MRKYRIKKRRVAILILIILLPIIGVLLLKEKSYSISYNIAEYSIDENYDRKTKTYYFEIKYDGQRYDFIKEMKYERKRQLIKDVNKIKDGDDICLEITSSYFQTNPLCYSQDTFIDYRLSSTQILNKLNVNTYSKELNIANKYNNYELFNLKDNLLIWNYNGFLSIKNDSITEINLFSKDIYNILLAQKVTRYLFIPNYEQKYNFSKAYVIDLNDFSKKEWNLKYEISFDSYILGTKDDSIFLVDKKNEIEYELVPYKRKMRIVGSASKNGFTYQNDKLTKVSMNYLTTKEEHFTFSSLYNYYINKNKLYLKYLDNNESMLVSSKEITQIVSVTKDTVYYLVDDTLYFYNPLYGETKVLKYSDWQYNYDNMIFIDN